jgi:hypothetical protein
MCGKHGAAKMKLYQRRKELPDTPTSGTGF